MSALTPPGSSSLSPLHYDSALAQLAAYTKAAHTRDVAEAKAYQSDRAGPLDDIRSTSAISQAIEEGVASRAAAEAATRTAALAQLLQPLKAICAAMPLLQPVMGVQIDNLIRQFDASGMASPLRGTSLDAGGPQAHGLNIVSSRNRPPG